MVVFLVPLVRAACCESVSVPRPDCTRSSIIELTNTPLPLFLRPPGDLTHQIPFLAERTDLVALLDEFASRFFDELDYVKECQNGVAIRDQMKHMKQARKSW